MQLHVEQHSPELSVVHVSGEVDLHSAPTLRDGLAAELGAGRSTVVDLTGVGFLDSTGLGALVAERAFATERGLRLPIVCTSARIIRLFKITGLDAVFDIHDTVAAAAGTAAG